MFKNHTIHYYNYITGGTMLPTLFPTPKTVDNPLIEVMGQN